MHAPNRVVGLLGSVALSGFVAASALGSQVPPQRPALTDVQRSKEKRELAITIKNVCAPGEARRATLTAQIEDSLVGLYAKLKPEFRLRMPPRFGVDGNGNGVPDLPNTTAYVSNASSPTALFVAAFDASETQPISVLSASQWSVMTVDGNPVFSGVMPTRPNGKTLETKVPEGSYDVTLRVAARVGCFQADKVRSRRVLVRDLLIVALGDSYAAGEGNPEKTEGTVADVQKPRLPGSASFDQRPFQPATRYDRTLSWGDDGTAQPMAFHFKYHAPRTALVDDSPIDNDTDLATRDFNSEFKEWTGVKTVVGRRHMRAHRSTVAWPAQLARRIEDESDEYSVTFVSLAATGATIAKGILGSYGASHQESISTADLLDVLPPQINEMRELVGLRDIDLLLVSVGGNDVGFSNSAKALVLKGEHTDISFAQILSAVKSGDWHHLKNQSIEWFNKDPDLDWPTSSGLDGLPGQYGQLQKELHSTGMPAIGTIMISQYPDLTRDHDGATCDEILEELSRSMMTFHITASELDWARVNILGPLNTAVGNAATTHGWVLLDGLAAFNKHGVCAGYPYPIPLLYTGNPWPSVAGTPSGRWFRRPSESRIAQGLADLGGTLGTLHPNEFGHYVLSNRAYDILKSRGVIP